MSTLILYGEGDVSQEGCQAAVNAALGRAAAGKLHRKKPLVIIMPNMEVRCHHPAADTRHQYLMKIEQLGVWAMRDGGVGSSTAIVP